MGILQDARQDPAEEVEDVQYTNEELGEVLANLGKVLNPRRPVGGGIDESKHSAKKTVTYETALKILRAMALDRISNTGRVKFLIAVIFFLPKYLQGV